MSYITPISKTETDNLSGLLQLRIARVGDVLTFPRIIGGRMVGDIVFKPGAGFVAWEVVQESSSFRSDSVDSLEGGYRDGRLSFTVIHPEESILERMERDRFMAYYLDANLKPVLFGTPDRPLLFRYSHQTGTIGGGRHEYSGQFISTAPNNKAIYNGSITDFTPLVVVRSNSMDGEVLATVGEGQTLDLTGDFDFREIMLPMISNRINRFATINYTRDGITLSTQVELGKTIIIISDFSLEFHLV